MKTVMPLVKQFSAWGHCIDCHFEGLMEFTHLDDEDYTDPEAMGVMLLQHCPSCDTNEHALIPIKYYREMLADLYERLAESGGSADE